MPRRRYQIIIESWRRQYNAFRPHASLGYKPPAPEAFVPAFSVWILPKSKPEPVRRVEVFTGTGRRRTWTADIGASELPNGGASTSASIAWRRPRRRGWLRYRPPLQI